MEMTTMHLLTVSKLLVLTVLICCCGAANVKFFWEHDFKGAVYEATSSKSCKDLPNGFKTLNGSVKTKGCIAVFRMAECEKEQYDDNWAFLITSEESRLSHLMSKYDGKNQARFSVSSYRDCTDMERRPQVDFDLFAKDYFKGEVEQFRDLCSCTNLRYDSVTWSRRSGRSYGDCFTMYTATNCEGKPTYTSHLTYYNWLGSTLRSMEPCHPPPAQCAVSFTANIFRVQPKTDISKPETTKRQVALSDKQVFVNNGSSAIERSVETNKQITETLHFQLSNATHPINDVAVEDGLTQDLWQTISPHSQNHSLSAFQAFESNGTFVRKRELRVLEKLTLPPCTKINVVWLAEIADMEQDYEVDLKITATIQGSKSMEAEFIPHYFEGLNFSTKYDNFTSVAKTAAKLSINYAATTRLNVTTEPIPECSKRLINLKAQLTSITPITKFSNLTQKLENIPMTTKQIFMNSGTTQQKKIYEAMKEVIEIGIFLFSKELNQIVIHKDLKIDNEPTIPFLTSTWAKLKSGEMTKEQNELIPDNPVKYTVRSNKTYRVQEIIAVPPCTEYEVGSFVKIASNIEIDYKIQLRVTGQLGSDSVSVEEIRENLEGLQFLTKVDNFTGLFETTAKLQLDYGVSSGVEVVETPIPSCRLRFIKYAGTVINLERISNSSNSTGSLNLVAIAPKLVFINNSTTQQEESYEAAKEIIETAKFEFLKDCSQISFIKFDETVKGKLDKSIPFHGNVWTKLKGGIVPNRSNWNEILSFEVLKEKEFRIQKNIVQAPCMRYELSAFIETATDVEVSYRVLLEVTGELGSEAVRAREIRGNLKDMTFLHDKDDFTVVAETTMKLRLNYGIGTGVDNAGTQMLDCMEIQAALVANCKFTCSG